jgi:rhodanese-related sulfurtransferase
MAVGRDTYLAVREQIVGLLHDQARKLETMSLRVHQIDEKAQHLLQEKQKQRDRLGLLVDSAQKAIFDIQSVGKAYDEVRVIKSSIQELLKIEDAVRGSLAEIDSVALNSRILAFNASLEAGRAGVEGKGFLVVSDKMREFSQEIAVIAKTIRGNSELSKGTLSRITEELDTEFHNMETAARVSTQLLESLHKEIAQMDTEFAASLSFWEDHALAITDLQNQVAATVEDSSAASAEMVSFLQDSQIDQLEPQDVWQSLREFDYILDVRRMDEFNAELGHIEGAELITIDESFASRMESFPRNSRYVFVCRSGGRSARAARIALDMGFTRVANLLGGMLKWKEQSLPSVHDTKDQL